MYGKGILKGLGVTLNRFFETYLDDISWWMRGKKRYYTQEGIAHRASKDARGIFTVQYPEERRPPNKNKRPRPYLIEARSREWGERFEFVNLPLDQWPWGEWRTYKGYRTEAERDAALERLNRRARSFSEYRVPA